MSREHAKGVAAVVVSASCSATLAILLKYAFQAGANITTIIGVRFLVAALLLWLILRVRRVSMGLPLPQIIALCVMGAVGYGGMSLLFAQGLQYISASLAGMLLYTYPAIVTVLSFLLKEERFDGRKGLALLICLGGLYLVLGVSYAGVRTIGIASVLAAAFIYSVYILAGNRLLRRIDAMVAAVYICGSTGLAFAAYGAVTHSLQTSLPLSGWLAILGITLLPTFLGIVSFLAGIRLIGASRASIICTLEPFITVLLSILFLGERVSLAQMGGGGLIIGGVLLLQFRGADVPERDILRET